MSKRVFDLLFGFFTLILAIPLMSVSALLVSLEDGCTLFGGKVRTLAVYAFCRSTRHDLMVADPWSKRQAYAFAYGG